jgi:hypothetical protein
MASAVGAAVSIAQQHQVTARALIASNSEYEPRLTVFAQYDATFSPRFKMHLAGANSNSDERFNFTSVWGGATYMLSPLVGVSADVSTRFDNAERSTLLVGILVRR